MRIKGVDLTKPSITIIPIIKGDQEIIFQAACVTDYSEFEALVKKPEPPMRTVRGEKVATPNFESQDYQKAILDYGTKQTNWMMLKSLEATDGLDWETIDMSNPSTWENFEKELKSSGFNDFQIIQIIRGITEANGLSEDRINEARKRFLAMQQDTDKQPSQKVEPLTT
jgi:hypothetical protein